MAYGKGRVPTNSGTSRRPTNPGSTGRARKPSGVGARPTSGAGSPGYRPAAAAGRGTGSLRSAKRPTAATTNSGKGRGRVTPTRGTPVKRGASAKGLAGRARGAANRASRGRSGPNRKV